MLMVAFGPSREACIEGLLGMFESEETKRVMGYLLQSAPVIKTRSESSGTIEVVMFVSIESDIEPNSVEPLDAADCKKLYCPVKDAPARTKNGGGVFPTQKQKPRKVSPSNGRTPACFRGPRGIWIHRR